MKLTCFRSSQHVLRLHEQNGRRQMKEMEDDEARHKFYNVLRSSVNNEAAMQGKWRRQAFPERIYERLSSDVVCAGLSSLDERTAVYELQTSLPDSFVGLSYTYTDTGQSEGWMKSVLDDTKGNDSAAQERKAALDLANDDGVVGAQVQATMASLLINVQDRVMTESGVLKDDELKSANWAGGDVEEVPRTANDSIETMSADSPDIVEQPVWGIDCYTRRNITSCIEIDFDSSIALEFIEKWLLPAINACPVEQAHNMINAARILEGISLPNSTALEEEYADDSGDERWSHSLLGKALKDKMVKSGPPWLKSVAHQLRLAISTLGHDFFRVHPKGHGAIVLQPKLKANTLVTFYRGEVYPSWRWGEKMDAIELTQNRLGLRPNLPDFYNMALERPQKDPRGYGLLFVDASRKAGHGSSLSHSCEPTCEVRVAAVNGKLCLAMTTIRELELGEEVTFDYNAVTESLNEYRSAVCLCGHGKCRGSFLHFATADCYQEVLNRNSPIAVRLSNIIKGCTKQVMSEADEALLATHGFGTAAFGAVSFKRAQSSDSLQQKMENVPIWLRTYVADTIRYIEYERRALPVMLLCNHLKRTTEAVTDAASSQSSPKNGRRLNDKANDAKPVKKRKKNPKPDSRPIPGSKPEPVFLFFSRKRRDFFRAQLVSAYGSTELEGLDLQRAMMKVASSCWNALSDEMKEHWKQQAVLEWKENGGEEKARLEAERLKAEKAKPDVKRKPKDAEPDGVTKQRKKSKSEQDKKKDTVVHPAQISFEAADAEGVSAMEQRIQQLTQTLSRVGRVLDRHRESNMRAVPSQDAVSDGPAQSIHSPLENLCDDDVVYWLWRHENGPVRSLLRACSSEKCVSPSLLESLKATEKKHSSLLNLDVSQSVGDSQPASLFAPNARTKVKEALLDLRDVLCNGLLSMEGELKQHELERSRVMSKARREKKKKEAEKAASVETSESCTIRETVSSVLSSMIDTVVERSEKSALSANSVSMSEPALSARDASGEDPLPLSRWLKHFGDRWKLEAAADLLLFYAHTSTFFAIKPYKPLESTPIEVYARELGNAVPLSVVETAHEKSGRTSNEVVVVGTQVNTDREQGVNTTLAGSTVTEPLPAQAKESSQTADTDSQLKSSKAKSRALCKPDDIITNVAVSYRGDYVLSQLLQWYNGGIGQKPGLPDLVGCVMLPSMEGPWKGTLEGKTGKKKLTRYASEVRPLLLDWLNDPRKRGSPFADKLSQVFPGHILDVAWDNAKFPVSPVGSPVLDLLVTGEDTSLRMIASALSETIRSTETKNEPTADGKAGSATDRLQNTVDEGMPAQAVSHWVQCEHPNCLKWRKLPWHVDVDALPEAFYCSDNKWNPAASSCDAPEDEWDEYDSQLKNEGIAKESDGKMVAPGEGGTDGHPSTDKTPRAVGIDAKQFIIGARFDVLRSGKDYFSTGEVVNVDYSGSVKRVLFHFPKTKALYDEWLEIGSPRIAPLNTKQDPNNKGSASKKKKAGKKTAKETGAKKGDAVVPRLAPPDSMLSMTAKQNGAHEFDLTSMSLKAQFLKGLMGSRVTTGTEPASTGSRLAQLASLPQASPKAAYVTQSTVHQDGSVSMQRTNHPQCPPTAQMGPLVVPKNDREQAPVLSSPSASFKIPRKAPFQGGAGSPGTRIPRKTLPPVGSTDLATEASLLVGMPAASAMSRGAFSTNAFSGNYFPPNLPDPTYPERVRQGQVPFAMPNNYFDARNHWQGQQQQQFPPRRFGGGSPNKKQYDGRR